jgi:TPP-dependent pyruvate/acetoin dehydrogenase alpha subunit
MTVEIKMVQLGQTSDEVRLVKWLVSQGDVVKRGQPICEVETDKVVMEFESVQGGTVAKLIAQPDAQIKTGEIIALIEPLSKNSAPAADGIKPGLSPGIEVSLINKGDLTGIIETTSISEKDINGKDIKGNDIKEIEVKDGGSPYRTSFDEAYRLATAKVRILGSNEKKKILSGIGTQKAIAMYKRMLEIREFEERIKLLFLEGKMPGTIHQYIGQEACAVGVCSALESRDIIASTHRPHGHAIARGVGLNEVMAELYGKTTGCCKGKGGSMHVGDLDKGVLPAIAIVGGNIPIIGGMALAFKMRGEPRVAVSFFGDGASNEGAFHEALNMAAMYQVPAVFVCENNLYGASTSIKLTVRFENIAQRVCSYGMRGDIGDGMDVLDVYVKAKEALDIARSAKGPTLLELKTFRLCGHSRRDPCNYMTKEERLYWAARDPINSFEQFLLKEGVFTSDTLADVKNAVGIQIDQAVLFGQNGPDPKPEDTYEDLYVNMEVPR